MHQDHRIMREEIFGPVVAATPDVSKAHQLAARIKAGTAHINTYQIYNAASSPSIPNLNAS